METLIAFRDSAEVSEEEKAWLSTPTLKRYLDACAGKADDAVERVKDTLKWRRDAVKGPLHCSACETDPFAHCFLPIGVDEATGRLFVYGCPPRATKTEVGDTMQHVCHVLEHGFEMIEQLKGGESAARWTWLVDFNGFGFSHAMQGRLGISFATVFANHFPERLAKLVLINPPTVFSILLAAIQPFADARTLSKVVTISGDPDSVATQLAALDVPVRQVEWMRQVLALPGTPGALPPLPAGSRLLIPCREGVPVTLPEAEEDAPGWVAAVNSPRPTAADANGARSNPGTPVATAGASGGSS